MSIPFFGGENSLFCTERWERPGREFSLQAVLSPVAFPHPQPTGERESQLCWALFPLWGRTRVWAVLVKKKQGWRQLNKPAHEVLAAEATATEDTGGGADLGAGAEGQPDPAVPALGRGLEWRFLGWKGLRRTHIAAPTKHTCGCLLRLWILKSTGWEKEPLSLYLKSILSFYPREALSPGGGGGGGGPGRPNRMKNKWQTVPLPLTHFWPQASSRRREETWNGMLG